MNRSEGAYAPKLRTLPSTLEGDRNDSWSSKNSDQQAGPSVEEGCAQRHLIRSKCDELEAESKTSERAENDWTIICFNYEDFASV